MAETNQPIVVEVSKPRVYISYTWRTPGLLDAAFWLAEQLRAAGIDSRIDLFYGRSLYGFTPPPPIPGRDAWDYWQEQQVKSADRIIVFCTPEYLEGSPTSGTERDLRYMREVFAEPDCDPNKFIPVGLGSYSANAPYFPDFMEGATYYDLGSPRRGLYGLEDLIRRLKTEFPAKKTRKSLKNSTTPNKKNSPEESKKVTEIMTNSRLKASQLKGKVHAAIITIRPDEYEAVEARLGNLQNVEGNNNYKLAEITPLQGEPISVVLTRVVNQGNARAQAVASNIIHDLDPAWIILVGIAGGVPDNEFSLGDVVLATYLHDFSFTAVKDGTTTYQAGGGNMHREVERFLSTGTVGQDGRTLKNLAGFDSDPKLMQHPMVYPTTIADAARYYGSDSHKRKVENSIAQRFPNGQRRGGPLVWQGPCANGDVLVKDTDLLNEWQQHARQVVQVETELSGVYEAARTAGRENYPVLAIRGLSDIIGFTRYGAWTPYACETAAAYTYAILKSGLIDFSKNLPPNPS